MSARLEEKGAHNLPLIILFGAILAMLFAVLFILIYDQQLNAMVDEQARSLADELASTAFASLSGGLHTVELPKDLAGSTYTISVQENSIFVVKILTGRRSGSSYSAVVNATVSVENGNFQPGGQVFFLFSNEVILVSAVPIEPRAEKVIQVISTEPPLFYHFSKKLPREAAAIVAAYFDAVKRHPEENVVVLSYARWENNSILIKIREGNGISITRVVGKENQTKIGAVENSWVIEILENYEATDNLSWETCPSPDNAYLTGWLHSPQAVLKHLRSRTWSRVSDNAVVAVPDDAVIKAAAVTTKVATYPVWKVQFGDYTIFYQMLPWWENENTAGFVFQSSPELKPLT